MPIPPTKSPRIGVPRRCALSCESRLFFSSRISPPRPTPGSPISCVFGSKGPATSAATCSWMGAPACCDVDRGWQGLPCLLGTDSKNNARKHAHGYTRSRTLRRTYTRKGSARCEITPAGCASAPPPARPERVKRWGRSPGCTWPPAPHFIFCPGAVSLNLKYR